MSRADDERIDDIVEAAAEIAAIVADGKESWDTDRVRQLAVERLLEIIGESARAMTDGVGLPLLAALAGWLLAGREPPSIARQPLQ